MSAAEQQTLVDIEAATSRRAEWRAGFDSGLRAGAQRVLESDALQTIAFEISVLRLAVGELAKRERWYQAKLQDAYHVIGNPRAQR